jgi:hypothetical protein
VGGVLLLTGRASARDDGGGILETSSVYVTDAQRRGITKALAWIHSNKSPGGKWGKTGQKNTEIADTALSVLALMAGGNTLGPGAPDRDGHVGGPTLRGPYAADVRDGIDFLARLAYTQRPEQPLGYISDGDDSKMHGQGFATMALATACAGLGSSQIREIKALVAGGVAPQSLPYADRVRLGLEHAVRLIEGTQDFETGGWYYLPIPEGHEGSMTVTEVTALRAASESGVAVNGTVMKKAYEYLRKSQNTTHKDLFGGFMYKIGGDSSNVSVALTAASLTTLFGIGRYGERAEDAEIIDNGMRYIDRRWNDEAFDYNHKQFYYYRLFYLAQALYLSGDEKRQRKYLPLIRDNLLELQRNDGSFRGDRVDAERSPEYCTAIACLTLQTPLETLPIFQRR